MRRRATAKINIPAVKIIGTAPSFPTLPAPSSSSLPFELLAPSSTMDDACVPDPASSSSAFLLETLVPEDPEGDAFLAAATPPLLLDDGDEITDAAVAGVTADDPLVETELGEFLLDAVDWL